MYLHMDNVHRDSIYREIYCVYSIHYSVYWMQRVTYFNLYVGFYQCPWAGTPQDQWLGKASTHSPSWDHLKPLPGGSWG